MGRRTTQFCVAWAAAQRSFAWGGQLEVDDAVDLRVDLHALLVVAQRLLAVAATMETPEPPDPIADATPDARNLREVGVDLVT